MATITFNTKKILTVNQPLVIQNHSNLMFELLQAGLPVASSCHGKGVCGKCSVTILSGMENILPETELEQNLKLKNKLNPNQRISCQIQVTGDIQIDTSYW